MKRIFFLFLATITTLLAYSQENDSIIVVKSPAGRLSGLIDIQDLVNEGFNYWDEEFEGHWAGVELGVNSFIKSDYSLYPAAENNFLENNLLLSNVLNINVLQYSKGLQQTRNTIGLVTGIGLSLQSYHLNSNTTIELDENRKVIPQTLFFDSNQKSKLSSVYLEVPLLVEFQIPVSHFANRVYFSAGIIGSKRLETHTKIKYRKNGERQKLKSPGDYSIRDFKVSGTIRMGYRWINLFASCDVVPLFEDRRGPELYPFTVGIKLISF
ncbi:MAG: outer membrane beta-barrel protein [Prolixibacteraceae bacterium]|nr:outer membrane beta-barrel protein [Prolixibacteraceae bacterium]